MVNCSKKSNENPTSDQQNKNCNTLPCANCKSPDHTAVFCIWLSCIKRYEYAVQASLCLICLQRDHETAKCPKSYYRCYGCNESHNRSICNKPRENKKPRAQTNVAEVHTDDSDDDFYTEVKHFFANTINQVEKCPDKPMFIPVEIQEETFPGLVDTGANINLISRKIVKEMGFKLHTINQLLTTPNGDFMSTGSINTKVKIGNLTHDIEFLVNDHQDNLILGTDVIKKFALNINDKLELFQRKSMKRINKHHKCLQFHHKNKSKVNDTGFDEHIDTDQCFV